MLVRKRKVILRFYQGFTPFYDSKAKHGCFSNYWSIPGGFYYREQWYPTSEHAFQAAKFIYTGASEKSLEYGKIISNINTANKSRLLGNQKTGGGYKWRIDLNPTILTYKDVPLRPNWDDIRVDIMYEIVKEKVLQSEFCWNELKSTGSTYIFQNSPGHFWSCGLNHSGTNHLGRILMHLRNELFG